MKSLILGLLMAAAGAAQVKVPRPAPRLNLLEPCRGKVTLVAFIVTTCAHCKAFTRAVMEPLYESKQVCAAAIAFDTDADTARFAAEQNLQFPVYSVSRDVVRAFMGVTGPDRPMGTPQVAVIDKQGIIQAQSTPQGSPLLLQPEVIREIVERLK